MDIKEKLADLLIDFSVEQVKGWAKEGRAQSLLLSCFKKYIEEEARQKKQESDCYLDEEAIRSVDSNLISPNLQPNQMRENLSYLFDKCIRIDDMNKRKSIEYRICYDYLDIAKRELMQLYHIDEDIQKVRKEVLKNRELNNETLHEIKKISQKIDKNSIEDKVQAWEWEPNEPIRNKNCSKKISGYPKEYNLSINSFSEEKYIEGIEALNLHIRMFMNTEKYQYKIFSDKYGTEYTEFIKTEDKKTFIRLAPLVAQELMESDLFKEWIAIIYGIRKEDNKLLLEYGVKGNQGKIITVDLLYKNKAEVEIQECGYSNLKRNTMKEKLEEVHHTLLNELESVLNNINQESVKYRYYMEYSQLENNSLNLIMDGVLESETEQLKEELAYFLWRRMFQEKPYVDFRDMYILIDLINNHKINIVFTKEMQEITLPNKDKYLVHGRYYWKSKMESLVYLLEQCPQIYSMLSSGLKTKIKILCEGNITYLVRAFFLYESVEQHLERIEKEKAEIYAGKRQIDMYCNCVWSSEDYIFLRRVLKENSEIEQVDEYVRKLFCESQNYNMAGELWSYIKENMKYYNEEQIMDLIKGMDANNQIWEREKEPNIIKEFFEKCDKTFNLERLSNILTICRKYGISVNSDYDNTIEM